MVGMASLPTVGTNLRLPLPESNSPDQHEMHPVPSSEVVAKLMNRFAKWNPSHGCPPNASHFA